MGRWRKQFRQPVDRYARFVARHPTWIIAVVLALTFTAVFISVQWLKAERSTTALYDQDSSERKQYEKYVQEFGEPDDLIVVVLGGRARERRMFIQKLVHRLDLESANRIDHLFFRVPLRFFTTFLYASDSELKDLQKALKTKGDILDRLLRANNFEEIFQGLDRELDQGLKKGNSDENAVPFFESLGRFFASFRKSIGEDENGMAYWLTEWSSAVETQVESLDAEGFLTAEQGQLYLLFVKPADITADAAKSIELVRIVRRHIDELLPSFTELEVGLTGEPALTHDEFATSERDMLLATLFALATTALIFFISFRSFFRPFLGFFCLVMGVALTFGLVTVTLGHLNLFSLTFAVILVGLGTQYGIHIIARYEEERAKGRTILETVRTLLKSTVPSLWIGALTTAVAFYSTLVIDFKGFQELGFIAGSGVLICFVLMSFVLPAFLVFQERFQQFNPAKRALLSVGSKTRFSQALIGGLTRFPVAVLIAGGVLSAFSIYAYLTWGRVPRFDYNLLNLQAEGTEAVHFEKRLLATDVSPRFAVLMAHSPEEVQSVKKLLEESPHIGKVQSLFDLLPEATEEKLVQVHRVAEMIEEQLHFGNLPSKTERVAAALQKLEETFERAQEKLFASGRVKELETAAMTSQNIRALRLVLQESEVSDLDIRLNKMQEAITTDIRQWLRDEKIRAAITVNDLPGPLRKRFVSQKGTYAIYAYPKESIWNREGLTNYVRALRSISREVTGPPLQMFDALNAMADGWYRAAVFAAVVIFMLFLIDFRSFLWAFVAMIPLACGLTWICGGMAFAGLQWNIVNLIALPLVLGIGADCGIHLIHRYREEKKGDISFVLSSTGKAVSVAYADTLTSFLGLAVATHRGLGSLGQVIIWGIFCCYIAGMIILPALLGALRPWLQEEEVRVR